MTRRHRISAGAFVEDAGRLLLVRQRKPEVYDFWVAPGGGVQGTETLAEAATREVHEETGLQVDIDRLVYVEEFFSPHTRFCKFWFLARAVGGALTIEHPQARAEHIVQAGWHTQSEIRSLQIFPEVLQGRYWDDRRAGFPQFVHLGLREMAFW